MLGGILQSHHLLNAMDGHILFLVIKRMNIQLKFGFKK
ncbi:hypothetical protein SXYLSMQ121_0649 [Staphylococcus xylosus]|nr:hypothetical protein SXYLSMQ121_0649 [Staphylococcus xylosus]